MQDLILESVAARLVGLEHYIGIPSTVGGAIWQNLHFLSPAPERERTMFIAEVFESCEILTEEGERKTVGPEYVRFGYDDSVFHHRARHRARRHVPARPGPIPSVLHRDPPGEPELARRPPPVARWSTRAPAPSSRRSRAWAPGGWWTSAGSRAPPSGARRSPICTPTSSSIWAGPPRRMCAKLIALAQREVAARFGQHLVPEIGFVGEFK